MRDSRNVRVMQLAWTLENLLSADVTNALAAINERLAHADGYPTQTIGASAPIGEPRAEMTGPCGSCDRPRPCRDHDGATLTPTERSADIRYRYGLLREELRDRLDGLVLNVDSTLRFCRMVMGAPLAEDVIQVPMCRDAQVGREGAAEWGDALCPMPAATTGLCGAHYQAARKYRIAHGLRDTTTQPATDEHYPDGYRARAPRQEPAA